MNDRGSLAWLSLPYLFVFVIGTIDLSFDRVDRNFLQALR